jgi:hypothetical protein
VKRILLAAIATAVTFAGGGSVVAHGASVSTCQTHALQIRQLWSQGGLGSDYTAIRYANKSATACRTQGTPDITLYGQGHRWLSSPGASVSAARPLLLRPGGSVYSIIKWGEIKTHKSCKPVRSIRLHMPNSTELTSVALNHVGPYCFEYSYALPLASSPKRSLAQQLRRP